MNIFGDGIFFSEGEKWKSKRKLFSSLFTFDMLKSLIPPIVNIANNVFNELAGGSKK